MRAKLSDTRFIQPGQSRKLGYACYAKRMDNGVGGVILSVTHHATEIVRMVKHANGIVMTMLDAGGWRSITTLERINHTLASEGYTLEVRDRGFGLGWEVYLPCSDQKWDFGDGMILKLEPGRGYALIEQGTPYALSKADFAALDKLSKAVRKGHEFLPESIRTYLDMVARRKIYFGEREAMRTIRNRARHHGPDTSEAIKAILAREMKHAA